jgi:hypothetical protein
MFCKGRKGIGFKSVFKITDTPQILSGAYAFQFDAKKELGFIVPEWLASVGHIPEPIDSQKTHFFLPLDKPNNNAFDWNELYSGLDCIPLFLHKLKTLTIQKYNPENNTTEEKKITVSKTADQVQLTVSTSGLQASITRKFFVISKTIAIPEHFSEELQRNPSKHTEITLAFPVVSDESKNSSNEDDNEEELEWDLFAFLPVQKVGFHFIIQADFNLVTSRQAIHQDKHWNKWLREQIPGLFLEAVHTIPYIRFHLHSYVPAFHSISDSFWAHTAR